MAIVLTEEGPATMFSGYNDSSRALKERGITLMSVGVGNRVNQYELQRIATRPELALMVNTLDDAIASISNVANATCLAKPTPPQGRNIMLHFTRLLCPQCSVVPPHFAQTPHFV